MVKHIKCRPELGLLLILLLFSCSRAMEPMVTAELSRSDYVEEIATAGTIQAVKNQSIMGSRDYIGVLTVEWAKPEGSRVEAGDTVCILKCDDLKMLLDDLERKLETLQADFRKQEADNALDLAVLEAQLKENQAGMSINQLDSVQMRFAPPVKKRLMELELEKARVAGRKLEKKYQAQKTINETEIRQLKSRIIQAENQVQSMRERVNGLIIKAPTAGILTAAQSMAKIFMMNSDGSETELGGYPQPGAMIFPELPLMALPDLSEMEIKLEVQEVDYKRIEKGQLVDIAVESAGGLRTTGSVKSKSMAPKTVWAGKSKLNYYDVIIGVDSCHDRMTPGLSAKCTIEVSRIRDTVVAPTLAIFEKDSLKIVYVAEDDQFTPVTVATGQGNGSYTIVTKGLSGTETIALSEPPHQIIKKPKKESYD